MPQPSRPSARHIQKVLRCKEESAETLSPHKGGSPKEHMRFTLGLLHADFPELFPACSLMLGWGRLMLIQLISWFLFTSSFLLSGL